MNNFHNFDGKIIVQVESKGCIMGTEDRNGRCEPNKTRHNGDSKAEIFCGYFSIVLQKGIMILHFLLGDLVFFPFERRALYCCGHPEIQRRKRPDKNLLRC